MASLEFDTEVNALYLRIKKGSVPSSEPLADNLVADLDSKGKVVGLELLLPPRIKKEIKVQFEAPASK